MIEYVVTKYMVRSTFVPSLNSIEAFFNSFTNINGGFSMKTSIVHKMLIKKWVKHWVLYIGTRINEIAKICEL
jgi:hypothetical protein